MHRQEHSDVRGGGVTYYIGEGEYDVMHVVDIGSLLIEPNMTTADGYPMQVQHSEAGWTVAVDTTVKR